MCGDEVATHVKITNGNIEYENVKENLSPVLYLFGDNKGGVVSIADLRKALSYMVFEEARVDKEEILECLGLDEYNVFKIVEKSNGVMVNNNFWIRFSWEKNLNYEDVRLRNGLTDGTGRATTVHCDNVRFWEV